MYGIFEQTVLARTKGHYGILATECILMEGYEEKTNKVVEHNLFQSHHNLITKTIVQWRAYSLKST
ncbi:hypothetical protein [Heliothis virescens ascovirus 3e]|uniref:Uncharacterized protein n=1 Tax=Heliothis virescens ascovirus 3e TaxID=260797 RepID=A4KXN0_HVAVE|nr:hypothetical protein HVAV3e_gp174 [Heliothis virescens ascovirus 3e]ABO37361.1 hypothetical protein [Heliothis virescens ascovirus 3e]